MNDYADTSVENEDQQEDLWAFIKTPPVADGKHLNANLSSTYIQLEHKFADWTKWKNQ